MLEINDWEGEGRKGRESEGQIVFIRYRRSNGLVMIAPMKERDQCLTLYIFSSLERLNLAPLTKQNGVLSDLYLN